MKENTEQIIKYLFGELNEAERDTLEDRIFSEEEFAEFLSAVEKDLIDDYARNEMNADLRRRFEQKYLVSETRREKVRVASILQKELFAEKEVIAPIVIATESTVWQKLADFFRVPNLALAGGLAVILLFALFGSWLLLRSTPNQIDIVTGDSNQNIKIPTPQISPEVTPTVEITENVNKPTNNINKPTPTPKKPLPVNSPTPEKREVEQSEPPRIFIATLIPILRSDSVPTLKIPKNASSVQLKIVHDNQKSFVKYRLETRNQNGDLIDSRTISVNEKNLERPIYLNLPNSRLKAGSYEITLNGIDAENKSQPLKFYNFVVEK